MVMLLTMAGGASQASTPRFEMRVRLHKSVRNLELSGVQLVIAPPSGPTKVSASALATPQQARILSPRPGQWRVRRSDGREDLWLSPTLLVHGRLLRLNAEPVPYDLELRAGDGGGIDVITRLDLDTYLMGVLPAEMPPSWPLEALKAQAVAARSFALRSAFERRTQDFDVDASIFDQVYKFLQDSADHPEWTEKVRRAVRETRGEVLVDSRGRVLKAFYSADGGCMTEDSRYVWGGEGLTSVRDPSCVGRPPTTWQFDLPRTEVRRRLVEYLKLPPQTELKAMQVAGRTPSGRVMNLIAELKSEGRAINERLSAQEFRRLFGFASVRSTAFALRWLDDRLHLDGTGLGHGVGLSQMGARQLAIEGRRYSNILKLYYPEARLLAEVH